MMKFIRKPKQAEEHRVPHPELGESHDPAGLMEHRETCIRSIERVLSVSTIKDVFRGGYTVTTHMFHPAKKMRAIEFAMDNYAQWEIESLREATAIDIEQLDAALRFEKCNPVLFHALKFLIRYKPSVRDMTIRRTLLAEYLSILEVIPDQLTEETTPPPTENVGQDTIDESI